VTEHAPPIIIPNTSIRPGPWEATLRALVGERGWRRVAVVCGSTFAASTGFADAIRATLTDAEILVWSGGTPHAPVAATEEAAAVFRPFSPDVIVSAGGGSSHDLAKGVAVLLAYGGNLLDYCLSFVPPDDLRPRPLPGPKVPIVTIPTTLSGSEANGAAGYAESGGKRVLADVSLTPAAVLVDGEYAARTPHDLYLGSLMNALNHCVEGLASRRSSLFTVALFRSGLQELASCADALNARPEAKLYERAGVASALVGLGLPGSWLGLAHAIGHVIGASFGAPHGWCHAVIAPAVVRFNAAEPAAAVAHAVAADAVGVTASSDALAAWLGSRAASWGLPTTLSALGVQPEAIPAIAERAWRDHDSYYNPRRVRNAEEIANLLLAVA
jgi:alcohol dehydrogenase class IV